MPFQTWAWSLVAIGVTVLLSVAVLSRLEIGRFPATSVSDRTVTNVFAHAAGFLYGGAFPLEFGDKLARCDIECRQPGTYEASTSNGSSAR